MGNGLWYAVWVGKKIPSLGAEREEIARWAILAKEPACRGDLWWRGGGGFK